MGPQVHALIGFACFFVSAFSLNYESKGFDDTLLYKIDWPGSIDMAFEEEKYESMVVTTHEDEKYTCRIPQTLSKSESEKSIETGLSPLHFISPIFSSSSCSYRIEAYWAYEVCHGYHVKQYHEERDENHLLGKSIKVQEYFLGKWDEVKMEKLSKQLKEGQEKGRKFPTTKIDNVKYPYLEMEMSDGTLCDINNEPRVTKLRYVCYPHGKNEIYSLKEVSTCNYEAIILTSALCMHPGFVPDDSTESVISCSPLGGAPEKPLSWLQSEIDSLKLRYKTSPVYKPKESIAILKVDPKDGTVRMDIIHAELGEQLASLDVTESLTDVPEVPAPKISTSGIVKDTTPVNEFLAGKNCLNGGSGWWKYEFCYAKHVRQVHKDHNGEVSLILGLFEESLHKEWLTKNPDKRPKAKEVRSEISHFYQGGTVCDKTGDKRQTEVKLKCLENAPSPATVSMYLLEPKTCQYILVVESPLICDILEVVDEDGLVPKHARVQGTASILVENEDIRYEND